MEKDVRFLRVDVDGYTGLTRGVPSLLKLFKQLGISASFFFVMGKEANLMDIIRFRKTYSDSGVLRRRYGISGIVKRLLFPKCLGKCHGKIIRAVAEKHEAGIHGWNHLRWVHGFERINRSEEIVKAVKSFEKILGKKPAGFVPPGFVMSAEVYRICSLLGIDYVSSRLGERILQVETGRGKILEIPLSSKVTLEENEETFRKELSRKLARVYIHADYEGLNTEKLESVLDGYEILPLGKAVDYLEKETVKEPHQVTRPLQ